MPHLHVWTELRSPLAEPSALSGRKNIQPDYTLVADPITSPNSAVVVVECKQYRRFSKGNFSKAVIDYAAGRPNAQIVLAAYGPVRSDFLTELAPEVANRITLLGHLRPGDAATRAQFRETLRDAIMRRFPFSERPAASRLPIADSGTAALKSVKLSWRATPRDLDLHLGCLVWPGMGNRRLWRERKLDGVPVGRTRQRRDERFRSGNDNDCQDSGRDISMLRRELFRRRFAL